MQNLTNKQMLELIMSEFKEYKKDWKEYRKDQKKINEMVVRHDEKIKGIWKIPVISGGIITLLAGIATIIGIIF